MSLLQILAIFGITFGLGLIGGAMWVASRVDHSVSRPDRPRSADFPRGENDGAC